MRKAISIPLIIIILFTGITVNLASHYCGGAYIASKLSLSGELATCGMEHSKHVNPGINMSDHTCQDFTSSYTFSTNYIPSTLLVIDDNEWLQVAEVAYASIFTHTLHSQIDEAPNRPPGYDDPSQVELEVICIFRI
jgi:hypothetical protein